MRGDRHKKPAGKPGRVADEEKSGAPETPKKENSRKNLEDKIDALNEASLSAIDAEKRTVKPQ
jgi:hypothetical protein